MADLRVHIAGVELSNPLIAASGTFGFGHEYGELYPLSELGGISCKGITLQERTGNPPPRIAETPSGMLNAVGLQNPGVDHFLREDLPWLREQGTAVIANIAGNTPEEYCAMAEKLSDYHENDLADALADLTAEERRKLYAILGVEQVAEIFSYLDDAEPYLKELPPEEAAQVVSHMDSDDAVDALDDLEEEDKEKIVHQMDKVLPCTVFRVNTAVIPDGVGTA